MFKKFLWLEWKAFTRASAFGTNMALKIILGIFAFMYSIMFLFAGVGTYYGIKEGLHQDPLVVVNKYLIYYFLADMVIRGMMQKMPVINIRPLLPLPLKRSNIVNFAIGKTLISFFNIIHIFTFVPFSVVLIIEGYDPVGVLLWWLAMWLLVYCNNLINLLLNEVDFVFMMFVVLLGGFGAAHYYSYFDITLITNVFYNYLYSSYATILVPLLAFAGLWWFTHRHFSKRLYLDTGLKGKEENAQTQEFAWLNRFGTMSTFLKNDLKLMLRNKRSKKAVITSFLMVFYGLLFFTMDMYDNSPMRMFASIFVTGGFMMSFGQFVPSWDSAYYPLMMSQNIPYRQYIASKWWLVAIGTAATTVAASFYAYFGLDVYLMILGGAIYNIGVNSLLVLLGGAYLKTPIDLASGKQAFGNKQAFNVKTLLISLPKMLLPMALYSIGAFAISPMAGFWFVAGAGLLGLLFRNAAFRAIERIYKSEKYSTLAAYKQSN